MRAVRTAITVLQLLAREHRAMGVNAISRAIGVNAATTYRILTELKNGELIQQEPETRRYTLGYGLLALGQAVERQSDLFQLAFPIMKELRDELGETVALCLRRHFRRIYIGQVQGFGQLRFSAPLGEPLPLYRGSAGKVFLAYLAPEELMQLRQLALEEGADWDEIMQETQQLHDKGYLWSLAELTPGAFSVSVPILDAAGQLAAVMAINGPIPRLTPEREERFGPRLREAASKLSTLLGGPGITVANE